MTESRSYNCCHHERETNTYLMCRLNKPQQDEATSRFFTVKITANLEISIPNWQSVKVCTVFSGT